MRSRRGAVERVERIGQRGRKGRQREGKKGRWREGGRGGGGKEDGKVGWITEGRESPLLLPYSASVLPSSHPFLLSSPSYPLPLPSIPTHSVRVELKQGYELTTHLVLHQLELNLSVDTGKVPVPV